MKSLPSLHHWVITSQNALTAIDHLKILPPSGYVFTVGTKTAEAAKLMGFRDVVCAYGNSQNLLDTITQTLSPTSCLIHWTYLGHDQWFDSELTQRGFLIHNISVYQMIPNQTLSDEQLKICTNPSIKGIVFHAAEPAKHWMSWVDHYKLHGFIQNWQAWCISKRVTEYLARFPWKSIHIAPSPDEKSLFEQIDA